MSRILLLFFLVLACDLSLCKKPKPQTQRDTVKGDETEIIQQQVIDDKNLVAAYLPEYRLYVSIDRLLKQTTDVILFSLEPAPDASLKYHFSETSIAMVTSRREAIKRNEPSAHAARILISVGGAGRSNHFLRVTTQSEELQKKLIENLFKLCKTFGLDGVDLDYEGRPMTEDDRKQFAAFMKKLKKKLGPNRILSVTIHPSQPLGTKKEEADGYEPIISTAVDRIHLMSYDMISQDENRHATTGGALQAVNYLLYAHVPPAKIMMGVPLYGRNMFSPDKVLTYSEIVDKYHPQKQEDNQDGYYFNGINTSVGKYKLAKQMGLGGVVFWEAGQDKEDTDTSVITAVFSERTHDSDNNNQPLQTEL